MEPVQRRHLLTEQIRLLLQAAPALGAGAGALSLLLLALTAGTPAFSFALAWCTALYGIIFLSMRAWFRSRRRKRAASDNAAGRSALNGLLQGILWGLLPVMLLPHAGPGLSLAVAVAIAGVLGVAAFMSIILPGVAFALMAPVLAGSFWATLALKGTPEGTALMVAMVTYCVVVAAMRVSFGGRFARHLFSETRIREQKEIISLLLNEFEEHSSDWLWELDQAARIMRPSERLADAAAQSAGSLASRDFCEFLRSGSAANAAVVAGIDEHIRQRSPFRNIEIEFQRNGEQRWWRLAGKPTYNGLDEYAGYFGTASDVTAEKLAQSRIAFLAHNDSLTGLLNRERFSEHLNQSVARLERYGTPFSILYLDLDQFKSVNDSFGHLAGDNLLVEVARAIKATLREDDIAARIGGDEFAVIMNSNCDSWNAATLAGRLIEATTKPYELDGEMVNVGLSIGIAIAPINGTRPDQILRNADLALYRAKAEGRGVYRFFESQMDWEARERRVLELELRQSLNDGDFILYYQPLISSRDNRPSGFEALIRWNHPIRGMVSPMEFIPVAEQSGLIREIGDWTLLEACRTAATWPGELTVAVNISAKHFEFTDIAAVVSAALAETGLPARRLELEITEGLLMKNSDEVLAKLTAIKALGVSIAMDDFGTGFSSLSYLLKFPFDKIKIDKSFVAASSEGDPGRDILRSIAALGSALNIRITAEGVETEAQLAFLHEILCDHFQGYYFSKPLDPPALANYLLSSLRPDIAAAASNSATKTRKATKLHAVN